MALSALFSHPSKWTGNELVQLYPCLLATILGRWKVNGKVWRLGWVSRAGRMAGTWVLLLEAHILRASQMLSPWCSCGVGVAFMI